MHKRLVSSYVSSVISTSLVLLLVGIASLLLVNAGNVSDYFKENLQISVIFKQEVTVKEAQAYQKKLESEPWIKNCEYVSREQGIEEMQQLLGADFLSVFDSAPIPISLNLSLQAEYVTPEKTEAILNSIRENRLIEDVVWQKSLIESLNANLKRISMVLAIFIALLLFVSFMLINNTIRLSLYNRRFSIHTMRLVGATKGFIRKPFMIDSLFQGVIAAQVAIIMLLCGLFFLKQQFPVMFTVFQLRELILVILIMLGAGVIICTGATFVVVGRMVNMKKEELYY